MRRSRPPPGRGPVLDPVATGSPPSVVPLVPARARDLGRHGAQGAGLGTGCSGGGAERGQAPPGLPRLRLALIRCLSNAAALEKTWSLLSRNL